MPNQAKIYQVQDITQKLQDATTTALVQYQGLTADEINTLRAKIKECGGVMEVAKNTLIIRALRNISIKLPQKLINPTALAYCNQDEIAPLKEIDKINQNKKLTEFKYAIYQKKLLSAKDLEELLKLPSHSTLIAQLIGGLNNPLQRLVYSLKFNQIKLLLLLKTLAEKQQVN